MATQMPEQPWMSPEDQAQMMELQRQRQMAQMMQQLSMRSQPTEMVSGRAVRQGILPGLTQVLGAYLGEKTGKDADKAQIGINERSQASQQTEMRALMDDPEKGIARALASRNPAIRAAAAALQKRSDERLDKWAGHAGKVDAPLAANQFRQGQMAPVGGFKEPESAVLTGPNGPTPVIKNFAEGGRPTATAFPVGSTVNVDARLGGKEGEMALDVLKTDLSARKGKADAAKDTLASSSFAIDALEQGAKAGGGEPTKQILRKALQAIGVEASATAEIDQLEMALGNAVLSQIAKLRPASDTDMKVLQKIMGGVGTDPKALVKGLAYANSIALRDLGEYGQYVQDQQTNLKTPYAQDLFSGAGAGYELPAQLNGPLPFQLETLRHIQKQGGDISRYRDPQGNPFSKDTKFEIDPTNGFPGIPRKANSTTPAPRKPIGEMTEAEKAAEIAEIRKTLGQK